MSTPRLEESLFASLDRFDSQIPLPDLWEWLQSCSLSIDECQAFLRFHPDRYVRNLVHGGPAYQALLLCWRNGQRSPIHDHVGSNCAVKVMQGTATETVFDHAPNGMIYPVSSRELHEGLICASQDTDIHQVSNLQAGDADLVTLHIYSPPLMTMNMYSLVEASCVPFFDPVNDEFVAGSGI